MDYDYGAMMARLSSSALTGVAFIALVLPSLVGNYVFVGIFILLVCANLVIVLAIKNFAPTFFARTPYAQLYVQGQRQKPAGIARIGPQANVGFRLSPLA